MQKQAARAIIDLEKRFWRALVEEDTDTALGLLAEPSLLVSGHGAIKASHEDYRRMADSGPVVVSDFELSDLDVVFPNDSTAVVTYHARQTLRQRADGKTFDQEMNDSSTWVKTPTGWKCVLHTETPAG